MQLISNFLHREIDAERRHLSEVSRRQQAKIADALDEHSVPAALFFGILCAVPAALVGILLIVLRM